MATLEDLMQQLLESSASSDKEMSKEITILTKKVVSAVKKAMSTSSDEASKLDLGQGSDRKGKAVAVEQAKEEPTP